jgi:hypothetical protein
LFEGKELQIHKGDQVYRLNIPQAIHSALLALRRRNNVRLLWIDAVCIDQANMDERNMLFLNIRKMFGVAEGLYIWLGDSSLDGRLAINFLKSTNLDSLVAAVKQTRTASSLQRFLKS